MTTFFFLAEGKVEIENKFLEAAFKKFSRAFSIVFKTRFRHEINYFYLPKEFLSLSSPISNLLKKVKRFVLRDQKKEKFDERQKALGDFRDIVFYVNNHSHFSSSIHHRRRRCNSRTEAFFVDIID